MKKKELIPFRLFTLDDFLSSRECEDLIIWSEQQGYEEAKVQIHGKQVMMKNIRNNSRITFFDQALADKIWLKVQPFFEETYGDQRAVGLNEMFRFYKYEVGERFNKHRDGSYVRNGEEASYYTLMIYLNDDFEGGETSFEKHIIRPEKGQALIFEHSLIHAGEPITSGIKYVLRTDIMFRTI